MPEFKYTNNGFEYIFYCDNEELFRTTEVAICFDKAVGCILKHGKPEVVSKYLTTARQAFIAAGAPEMANDVVSISSDSFDIKELNKILDTTGYINKFLESNKLFVY